MGEDSGYQFSIVGMQSNILKAIIFEIVWN